MSCVLPRAVWDHRVCFSHVLPVWKLVLVCGHSFAGAKAMEQWPWKGSWRDTGHSPVSLPSSTARSAALGGVRTQLPSQLCSSPGLCSCSCGHLGGPGLPGLWRERWAQPMGQDESSWLADVRSFLFLSFVQAGGLGLQTLETQTEHEWKPAFFRSFCPYRWGCL